MTSADTYHEFWRIITASYSADELRALRAGSDVRFAVLDALLVHDARERQGA